MIISRKKNTFTVEYQYDSLNRKTLTKENTSKTHHYSYTPTGQEKCIRKPDGTTIHKNYDNKKRLIALYSSDQTIDYRYIYDKRDRLTQVFDHKKPSLERKYDSQDRIVEETFLGAYTVKKAYDTYERTTKLTYPDNKTAYYTYTPYHLKEVHFDTYTHTYAHYDMSGRVLEEALIGGVGFQSHSYDQLGREKSRINPYHEETYEKFSPLGNLISRSFDGEQYTYSYDSRNQLIKEENTTLTEYHYDTLYNRRGKNNTPYKINHLNQLTKTPTSTYTYDANGNPILKTDNQTTKYTYDALDRLTKIENETTSQTYTYGPFHRRLAANEDNFIYDGKCEIGKITTGKITERRILGQGLGNEIGASIYIELNDTPYTPLHSIDGNIISLLDQQGNLQANYTYTAFGETAQKTLPWGYQSKRQDPTGLIYFGSRYYDPSIGRFLTTDPAGYTDSYNTYAYLLNRPFVQVDPDGEFLIAIPICLEAAVIIEAIIVGAVTAGVAWATTEISDRINRRMDAAQYQGAGSYTSRAEINTENERWFAETDAEWDEYKRSGLSQDAYFRKKKGSIDDSLPTDPHKNPRYEDISHPEAKKKGHYKFKDKKTDEIIEYDKGRKGAPGHEGHDHYHRPNPTRSGRGDKYLDGQGNPVPQKSEGSHLYPSEWIWW